MSWASTPASMRSSPPVARRRRKARIATPVTNIASVESMNGAPRIAPTPISSDEAPVAKTIAMIGIRVSGSAVPTAASTEPTAPSARFRERPNHSIPLVNSSAPIRMTTSAMNRTIRSNGGALLAASSPRPVVWREVSPMIPALAPSPASAQKPLSVIESRDVDFGVARSSSGQGTERRMTSVPTGGQP